MPHVLYIDQIFDTTLIRIKALTFCVVHHIIQSFKSILMSYFYLENARVRILCHFHIIFILAFYIQGILKSKIIIQDRTRDLRITKRIRPILIPILKTSHLFTY